MSEKQFKIGDVMRPNSELIEQEFLQAHTVEEVHQINLRAHQRLIAAMVLVTDALDEMDDVLEPKDRYQALFMAVTVSEFMTITVQNAAVERTKHLLPSAKSDE